MSEYEFISKFKNDLLEFLDYKHKLGHPYIHGADYLKDFDRFCFSHYPQLSILNKEMCLLWAQKRNTESNSGFISRITPLRQFGKYLTAIGINAYILPDSIHGKVIKYKPHIFTEDELKQFFNVVDKLEPYYQSLGRHLVAPVLFRLLYCCGLRPNEARLIEFNDVDLNSGKIFIKCSKWNKERYVMLPQDLLLLCRIYYDKIRAIFPSTKVFFPNHKGNFYTGYSLRYLFELCWSKSQIESQMEPKPRVYDFRHTYATHRIYKWIKEGRDLSIWIPYLSAFMGHSHYSSTSYYIHLIPDIFSDMSGFDLNQFEYLIPEVIQIEKD
jgi:integrase/recombinase XerD